MTHDEPRTRRRVLRLGAVGASAAFLAGCADTEDDPDAEEETGNGQDQEGEEQADDDDDLAADEGDLEDEGEDDEGPDDIDEADDWGEVDEILLETDEDVWIGAAPSMIDGEENPTLELTAGESYEIGYVNRDGDGHNLAIWGDDEERHSTDVNNEEGEDHWLSIDAEDDLSTYRCEVHPETMEGEIEIAEE